MRAAASFLRHDQPLHGQPPCSLKADPDARVCGAESGEGNLPGQNGLFFSTKDLSKASSTSRWNTVVGKIHKVCVEAGLRNP